VGLPPVLLESVTEKTSRFFGRNTFGKLGDFRSDDLKTILTENLREGDVYVRSAAAGHFKTLLERREVGFEELLPYLDTLIDGSSEDGVNRDFYTSLKLASMGHPSDVCRLIQKAVLREVQSLEADPAKHVWHVCSFKETLAAIEQASPEHRECLEEIDRLMIPFRNRIIEIPV
jgi:hypothetical protein